MADSMESDNPEPENIAIWYLGSKDLDPDERRRVFALASSLAAEPGPDRVVPLAKAIELFLLGAQYPFVGIPPVSLTDAKLN
jgi:hypothetical protein